MKNFLVPFAVLTLCACSNSNNIETYQVPKQEQPKAIAPDASMGQMPPGGQMPGQGQMPPSQGQMPMGGGQGGPQGGMELQSPAQPSDFAWKAPKGWEEKPGSAMRLATFEIAAGGNTPPYVATIVALGGQAGGFAANVNRWRGQLGMEPAPESEISNTAHSDKGNLGAFKWLSISNATDPNRSMEVAILTAGELSVFVKFVAPKAILAKQHGAFLSLCKSIQKKN